MRSTIRAWPVSACAAVLLLTLGCRVAGLKSAAKVDLTRTYQKVQVLPNYGGNPDCNMEACVVLFTDVNVNLYIPRVEKKGPGNPGNYNLSNLRAYETSDGSIVFAPPGWNPTEYRTGSGEIRIQFPTGTGKSMEKRGQYSF